MSTLFVPNVDTVLQVKSRGIAVFVCFNCIICTLVIFFASVKKRSEVAGEGLGQNRTTDWCSLGDTLNHIVNARL